MWLSILGFGKERVVEFRIFAFDLRLTREKAVIKKSCLNSTSFSIALKVQNLLVRIKEIRSYSMKISFI